MTFSDDAKKAGVIGWPIKHSRSPLIHNYWLKQHNIDGSYVPCPVTPEDLPEALATLSGRGFQGANVTIPHKEAALALVDEVDELARQIGAINTIVIGEKGELLGQNTDVFGFVENIRTSGHLTLGNHVVVLGAGGAARAILAGVKELGATTISLVNRTRDRAENLAQQFSTKECDIEICDWQDLPKILPHTDGLVNTTSLGMEGHDPLILDLSGLKSGAIVADIVYAPLETALLKQAKSLGYDTVGGLGMLLHQARPGFKSWFGILPEVTPELWSLVVASLTEAQNQ